MDIRQFHLWLGNDRRQELSRLEWLAVEEQQIRENKSLSREQIIARWGRDISAVLALSDCRDFGPVR